MRTHGDEDKKDCSRVWGRTEIGANAGPDSQSRQVSGTWIW
ncbi:hypothetical protein HTIA_1423 [Halorhabdus tiamatea SARL4B]|uniref:Uncharacterized protein n=1 Tax=Halorhabdus tiamatea SARL4B TaxID=1033806 RepID=S6D2U1_9EURY|nr:hypothetical protein HTIA_1423 [Halorhabdus tiamatea SARL4B]